VFFAPDLRCCKFLYLFSKTSKTPGESKSVGMMRSIVVDAEVWLQQRVASADGTSLTHFQISSSVAVRLQKNVGDGRLSCGHGYYILVVEAECSLDRLTVVASHLMGGFPF
jgi:hypothetical protein